MTATIVREAAPDSDRLAMSVRTPDGVLHRWADDEPAVERIPDDLGFSTGAPGGDKELSCQLLRDMRDRWRDLDTLNDVCVYGPGVDRRWNGYLVRTPNDGESVSPAAVGDVGRLKDDPSLRMIPVDRDLGGRWGEAPRERQIAMGTANTPIRSGPSVLRSDDGLQALRLEVQDSWVAPTKPAAEAWYDARGIPLEAVNYDFAGPADTTWQLEIFFAADQAASATDQAGDIYTAAAGGGIRTSTKGYPFAAIRWVYNATPAGAAGSAYPIDVRRLAVYGAHEIDRVDPGDGDPPGVLGPDVLRAVLDKTQTGIGYTHDSLAIDPFVIPHLVWASGVTAEQAILDVNRFYRNLWAVYERTLHWRSPEQFGRLWRVYRAEGARPESNGADAEQQFNGVIVSYTDPAAGEVTLGPPGSGLVGPAAISTSVLADVDPNNPLNLRGRRRWARLDAGLTSELGALRIGQLFLQFTAARTVSGRLSVGNLQLEGTSGARYPAWAARAGDRLLVPDDPNAAERLIVATDYTHVDRRSALTLDAPPDAIEAILARLQVALVGVAG